MMTIIIKLTGLIGLILAVLSIPKIISELSNANNSRLREEYKICKEFLEYLEHNDEIHPLLLERACLAISGKYLRAKEFLHLLDFPKPYLALKNYVRVKDYVEYDDSKNQIEFRKSYRRKWVRYVAKAITFTLGLMSVFLTVVLLKYADKSNIQSSPDTSLKITLVILIIGSIISYWFFYDKFDDLRTAERIVKTDMSVPKIRGSIKSMISSASKKPYPKFGSARGLIQMAKDFDDPLEDFETYTS